MAEAMARHSDGAIQRVLEVACGPASHRRPMRQLGWHYTGFDLHPAMVAAARAAAEADGDSDSALSEANMIDFDLAGDPVDLALCLLGSLYVGSAAELTQHLSAVARHLRPGGLYLLDWVVHFDAIDSHVDDWTTRHGDRVIEASYRTEVVDRAGQLIREHLQLSVETAGDTDYLVESQDQRAFYPQEFRLLVDQHPQFEFIDWWNDWNLDQPCRGPAIINRPLIGLRRLAD